jgi:hypothetical protein
MSITIVDDIANLIAPDLEVTDQWAAIDAPTDLMEADGRHSDREPYKKWSTPQWSTPRVSRRRPRPDGPACISPTKARERDKRWCKER